jgi:hypothetical protein
MAAPNDYWRRALSDEARAGNGAGSRAVLRVPRLVAGVLRHIWQRLLYREYWYLRFAFCSDLPASLSGFRELLPPHDRFWADPHVVWANDRYYIFIEEFLYRRGKGHISVIEMDEQGNCRDPVRVLERPYHLSYPMVFSWEGRYYMVPESAEKRTIELYECCEFPYRWDFKANLMSGVAAVDSTLFRWQDKWWLFYGLLGAVAPPGSAQLFLFWSDDLLGGVWHAHPLNPVVADVVTGRPAGGMYNRHGRIFRPSQDCSQGYGYGFDLYEVLVLSETDYREARVRSVRADWDRKARGTHTLACVGQLTMVDAYRPLPRLAT